MTAACDIPILLAQDTGDYNLIIFIVVAVLLAISGWIKRASEKKQEQEAAEARRKAALRQRQEAKRSPQAPRPAQQAAARAAQQVRRPAAPPPPPELPRVEILQAAPARALGEDLEQELRRQERRLRQEEKRRQEHLAARRPPEADSADIEQRLIHLRSQLSRPAEPMDRGGAPDLRSRELARSAIIYHVILAPPKALIQGPEMWDR